MRPGPARPARARARRWSGWPGAPAATSTSRWPARRWSCSSTLVVGTVGLLAVKARRRRRPATASTPPRCPRPRPGSPGSTPSRNESLTLIARGSGGAFEKAWQASTAAVDAELAELAQNPASTDLSRLPWAAYAAAHQEIRALDDGGDWDEAVALATGTGARLGQRHRSPRSTPAPTTQLGAPERPDRAASSTTPAAGCRSPARSALLAGLLAAACAWWGVSPAAGGVPVSRRLPAARSPSLSVLAAALATGACCGRCLRPDPAVHAGTPTPGRAVDQRARATSPSPAPSTGTGVAATNCLQSYAPAGALPAPGAMPSGSTMDRIQQARPPHRRRLGRHPAARRPQPGHRPDRGLRHRHAARGRAGDLRRPEQGRAAGDHRRPAAAVLQDGSVDIVARNMTITCDRWKEIAFSSEYYRSGQKVLVRSARRPTAAHRSGHGGPRRARRSAPPTGPRAWTSCAPSPASSPSGADTHTGCLVLFQQGEVDAITGDDTVLAGLAAQDPYADVVQAPRLHRRALRPRRQQGARRLRAVRQRRARADARRRPAGPRATTRWLADALGKAPAPPTAGLRTRMTP